VRTTEVLSFQFAKKSVPAADEAGNDGQMDAVDEGEQTGVAAQFFAELAKGAQTFLGLGHKRGIGLEGAEAHRVVDMGDGDAGGTQLFAEEHILVAIVTEPLVEGVGAHQIATDEEIGRVEILIGMQLPLVGGMTWLGSLLITVAEIALEGFGIASDGHAAVDDIGRFQRKIAGEEIGTHEGHVAVDEEQMVVLGCLRQQVADGGPADVLRLSEILAMGPFVDDAVLTDDFGIGGTVVGHQDFECNMGCLSLLSEGIHQADAQVVIGGNQYR